MYSCPSNIPYSYPLSSVVSNCRTCNDGWVPFKEEVAVATPPYMLVLNRVRCSQCSSGTFAPSGATRCYDCIEGSYCSYGLMYQCPSSLPYSNPLSSLLNQCRNCDEGHIPVGFSTSVGVIPSITYVEGVSCNACSPGTYALWRAPTCSNCEPGKYQPNQGQTSCLTCSSGLVSSAGSASCSTPPPCNSAPGICSGYSQQGSYCSGSASASMWADCPVGYSCSGEVNADGGNACPIQCYPGSFQPNQGQAFCLSCDQGQYQDDYAQTSCLSCSPGTYSAYGNGELSSCRPCNAGWYQPLAGQSSCSFCDTGTYQPNQGQTSCLLCEPGKYRPWWDSSVCLSCNAGWYQPLAGQESCDQCPQGFTSLAGSTSCPYPTCFDKVLSDKSDWHDSGDITYTCSWYQPWAVRCSDYGNSYAYEGMTANQACCACGGGQDTPARCDQAPWLYDELATYTYTRACQNVTVHQGCLRLLNPICDGAFTSSYGGSCTACKQGYYLPPTRTARLCSNYGPAGVSPYYSDVKVCQRCRSNLGICTAIGQTLEQCSQNRTTDAQCVPCTNALGISNTVYTGPSRSGYNQCPFKCIDGFYLSGNTCLSCQCQVGEYRVGCGLTSAGSCVSCTTMGPNNTAGDTGNAFYTSTGVPYNTDTCMFECKVGYYLRFDGVCASIGSVPLDACQLGQEYTGPGPTCIQCSGSVNRVAPSSNAFYIVPGICEWRCDDGFYRNADATACVQCSDTASMCTLGKYLSRGCYGASDVVCSPCNSFSSPSMDAVATYRPQTIPGDFSSNSMCVWDCNVGMYKSVDGTSCVACTNGPANSVYVDVGPSAPPSDYITQCPFVCNQGTYLSEDAQAQLQCRACTLNLEATCAAAAVYPTPTGCIGQVTCTTCYGVQPCGGGQDAYITPCDNGPPFADNYRYVFVLCATARRHACV